MQLKLTGGRGGGGTVQAIDYAYADRPQLCNLYSAAALPAVPFTSA